MPDQTIDKKTLKVYVKMHDGTTRLGNFYVAEAERLQDIMNDEREFLLLYAFNENSKKNHVVMLAKKFIEQVEEVVPANTGTAATQASSALAAPKEPPVVRQTSSSLELSLDDEHFVKKSDAED